VISAMYIGVASEAMPIPTPPRRRKKTKVQMTLGAAVPREEVKNIAAAKNMATPRLKRSETGPATRTPVVQPSNTQPDAQPFMKSLR